jgi:hypothetical protein
MTFLLIWLWVLVKTYPILVVIQMLVFSQLGWNKTTLNAALKLYGFRYWTFQRFLHENTRHQRIAELDEHDLALIEANKEVKALLEGRHE